MRRACPLVLVACVPVNVTGCGARTGLEVGDLPFDGASGDDGGEPGEGPARGAVGSFCALNVGPIPTCNAPASDGPVLQCNAIFTHCVNVSGQWGCCTSESGNNGAGGSCAFAGEFAGEEVPFDTCATH